MKAAEELKLRNKVRKVIASCTNLDQLSVAKRFSSLAGRKMNTIWSFVIYSKELDLRGRDDRPYYL
jgi:hypothetical protein